MLANCRMLTGLKSTRRCLKSFKDVTNNARGKLSQRLSAVSVCGCGHHNLRYCSSKSTQEVLVDEPTGSSGVVEKVNNLIETKTHERLFAVFYLNSLQYKVTTNDLVVFRANEYFADVGERISLDKVLLVGSKDFTLIGRPMLDNVRIEATVVEKTLSHEKVTFLFRKRSNYRKLRIFQDFLTVIRINDIQITEQVEEEVD